LQGEVQGIGIIWDRTAGMRLTGMMRTGAIGGVSV
jgi:hypothetical protein